MQHHKKIAVVLFNLGGPDKLSSVKPFLFNLFNDKAIINLPQPLRFFLAKFIAFRRNKKSQKIYSQIGGRSPLLEISQAQAHALEKELSFFGDFKVFVEMRYWHPMANEVIDNIFSYQPERLILLPLYPQFSTTTTASSFENFCKKFSFEQLKRKSNIEIQRACCYFKEPEFILAHAKILKQAIAKHAEHLENLRFLFSAHGLPQKLINEGDPYVFQIEETSKNVMNILGEILKKEGRNFANLDFKTCYQSKVGPLEWTGPSLDQELRRAIIDNKIPVIVPISFVSEHSETLVELDIDFRNLAKSLGSIDYVRVPALNSSGHFIKSLAETCKKIASSDKKCFANGDASRACKSSLQKCGFI